MSTTFLHDEVPYGCPRCPALLAGSWRDRGLKSRMRLAVFVSYRRISPSQGVRGGVRIYLFVGTRCALISLEGTDRQPTLDHPAFQRFRALTHPEIASRGAAAHPLGHVSWVRLALLSDLAAAEGAGAGEGDHEAQCQRGANWEPCTRPRAAATHAGNHDVGVVSSSNHPQADGDPPPCTSCTMLCCPDDTARLHLSHANHPKS